LAGELTNVRRDASGNVRFALEDDGCRVPGIIWARDAARAPVLLEGGMRVATLTQLGIYDRDARIDATVSAVRLGGDGEGKQLLERVRKRLEREGLLDPRRKRPIPTVPRGVAVITSQAGAVLHDILAVARRRHPGIPIFVVPTQVQGASAAGSVIRALGIAQRADICDVVIIARGGGAPADLAAFNDEFVARAIVSCRVPVITAIGHEPDRHIADEVADLTVGTASTAAERAVPERAQLRRALDMSFERARRTLQARLDRAVTRLELARASIARAASARCQRQRTRIVRAREQLCRRASSRVTAEASKLQRGRQELHRLANRRLEREHARIERLATAIVALDPTSVLSRGYAILSDERGRVVSSVAEAQHATKLIIRMHDGELTVDLPKSSPSGEVAHDADI
jgi:exodeoxyribonuclease VII large subunit